MKLIENFIARGVDKLLTPLNVRYISDRIRYFEETFMDIIPMNEKFQLDSLYQRHDAISFFNILDLDVISEDRANEIKDSMFASCRINDVDTHFDYNRCYKTISIHGSASRSFGLKTDNPSIKERRMPCIDVKPRFSDEYTIRLVPLYFKGEIYYGIIKL